MNIKVTVEVPKDIPKDALNYFVDRTVYNMAAITLERTEQHIPYRTGHMHDDEIARGVQGTYKTYTLGNDRYYYARYVWGFPQDVNWTNKKSYAQWFITEFKNCKETITSLAVARAKKVIK